MKTTCQICAREIKANTGVIGHHGYQRPFGWHQQTASCEGARHLPYEVSRDHIPVVIERYKVYAKNQTDMADEMLRSPADKITRYARSSYDSDTTFEKPDDFDPYAIVNGEKYAMYNTYESEFRRNYRDHRKNAQDINNEIQRLQQRYDDWRKQ